MRLALGTTWAVVLSVLSSAPLAAQTYFANVTEESLDGELLPALSVAVADYDNDGWPDLFLSEYRHGGGTRTALVHNRGGGRLERHDGFVRVQIPGVKGAGPAFADFDNDGDQDLFVPVGQYNWPDRVRNALLRNDRGVFTDVAAAAGLDQVLPTATAVWLDYDGDGYLDLYTGNLGRPETRNILYHNDGDGTFTDATAAAGLDIAFHPGMGGTNGGLVAGDFDDDGWPDLFVAAWGAPNRLLLNDGDGAFVDATTSGIADTGEAYGVAAGDVNNDGLLDLFQVSGFTAENRSSLYLNLGGGTFLDVTESAGLNPLTADNDVGLVLADVDNDGDLDVVGVAGARRGGYLFLNRGDGTFEDRSDASGIDPAALMTGAVADLDRDGFVDAVLGLSAFPYGFFGGLYRNHGNDNHSLRVELVGVQSNRDAIGARVVATAGSLRQTRQILGGNGVNQDERVAHFGLGARERVDELEIRWPSGAVQVLREILADRQIRVIEGRPDYQVVRPVAWRGLPEVVVTASDLALDLQVRPEPFEPGATITGVTVDLSGLGGPPSVALTPRGDGSYGLRRTMPIASPNAAQVVSVFVDQATSLGPYWSRLSKTVTILGQDEVILGDDPALSWRAQGIAGQPRLFEGRQALAFADVADVAFRPETPVSAAGFRALRFAFHPAGAVPDPPDTRLAYYHLNGPNDRGDLWEVFVTRADGRPPVNLTDNDVADVFQWKDQPAWSPDGTKVAFTSQRDGVFDNEIYLMNADGSGQVRLTNSGPFVGGPTWSPDGRRIYYSSGEGAGGGSIWAMDADGSNKTKVVDTERIDGWQDVSPDGRRIVFASLRDGEWEIFVAGLDGGEPVLLTDGPANGLTPRWSPDGTRIAFEEGGDIHVMNADGSNPVNLTRHPALDERPAWSPDGSQICFQSNRAGSYEIYVVGADGRRPIRLTHDDRPDIGPTWWPFSAPVTVALGVAINGGEVIRLPLDPRDFGPGLERRAWQEVEVPLDAFEDFGERIESVDFIGHLSGTYYLADIGLVAEAPPTVVHETRETGAPGAFALDQNCPNPFNPATTIRFALPVADEAVLNVYNVAGQRVATLTEGHHEAGAYVLRWDGRDDAGRALASGVYLYRLVAGERTESRKLLLLR